MIDIFTKTTINMPQNLQIDVYSVYLWHQTLKNILIRSQQTNQALTVFVKRPKIIAAI